MNTKLQRILLALGLSVAVFAFIGCSEDDEETTPTGPTMEERLVGLWEGGDVSGLGVDSSMYTFNSDGSYEWRIVVNLDLDVIESGTYSADDNSITFMVDSVDGAPSDTAYTWDHHLTAGDDTLHLDHEVEGGVETVTYINVTPPVN